jgi:uroporphyrinogen decarboxylase
VDKPLIRALRGETLASPPIWLMRQAGRYLPEYRALRAKTSSFLEFCYSPTQAVEATLQPIRRYGLDAAIIFSDILVVPDALGQKVWFAEGEGPRLEPLAAPTDVDRLSCARLAAHLAPVYAALRAVRAELPAMTSLLGFAGAPFTLATYMIEGRGGTEFHTVKRWAYADPGGFQRLIDLLVDAVADHLDAQFAAGADAVQIFDSWAGVLPADELRRWSVEPMRRIAEIVHRRRPGAPIIAFPRAVGPAISAYRDGNAFSAISLDTGMSPAWAARELQPHVTVQGNLDPVTLMIGGEALKLQASRILDALGHGPFVFNLGHGVLQHTPPDHVAELVAHVRRWTPAARA